MRYFSSRCLDTPHNLGGYPLLKYRAIIRGKIPVAYAIGTENLVSGHLGISGGFRVARIKASSIKVGQPHHSLDIDVNIS